MNETGATNDLIEKLNTNLMAEGSKEILNKIGLMTEYLPLAMKLVSWYIYLKRLLILFLISIYLFISFLNIAESKRVHVFGVSRYLSSFHNFLCKVFFGVLTIALNCAILTLSI